MLSFVIRNFEYQGVVISTVGVIAVTTLGVIIPGIPKNVFEIPIERAAYLD